MADYGAPTPPSGPQQPYQQPPQPPYQQPPQPPYQQPYQQPPYQQPPRGYPQYGQQVPRPGGGGVSVVVIVLGILFGGVAIVGILAAIAIPAFIKYIRKSKTIEAVEALDKIKVGARQFYVSDHWDEQGNLLPKRFPTTTARTPAQVPCGKHFSSADIWGKEGWKGLHFALTDPHYYAYEFKSSGTGKDAVYTARAFGDLDCDGRLSTYEIRGRVDDEYSVVVVGPIIENEIE